MTLSRKAAFFGVVAATATALFTGGMGTAQAAPNSHGAIAVGDLGDTWAIGLTWNWSDQASADEEAYYQCGYTNCVVQVRFSNGCGAVVDRDNRLYSGTGRDQAEAERNALAASGSDPNPLLVSLGSAEASKATVIAAKCSF